ncbi:MAG: histidine triad nucleotide-binding protein [Termitinemataceae bacterium]|nr:MAG: histidine triad nucleotide-binding protein [Termitinemataceae bacterium]
MADCIFCKIISGAIPSKKIFEDDDLIAFYDVDPKAPVHFLVIPKKHISNLMECNNLDSALLGKLIFKAQDIAKQLGLADNGARFIINCKKDGGQTVDHLHIHVLGGRSLDWPPG